MKWFLTQRQKLILLGYHSVWHQSNREKLHGDLYQHISLPLIFFEQHIRYLQEYEHTFLTFSDLKEIVEGKSAMPSHPVIIYFDDGYKDVLENVYPVLKRLGVPACLFITTDFIEGKRVPSWAIGKNIAPHDIFLTWSEVQSIQDVFEVGSHCVTHRKLSHILPAEVSWELATSRDSIEKNTGKQLLAVSYPHSAYSTDVQKEVTNTGYIFSVGNGRGYNYGPAYTFLKKIPIYPHDNAHRFAAKLSYFPLIEAKRIWVSRIKKVFRMI